MIRKFRFFTLFTLAIFELFFISACSNTDKIIEAYDSGKFEEASNMCLPRAEKEDPYCLYLLGRMAYDGSGRLKNYEEAFKYFIRASHMKHRYAYLALAIQFINGDGIPANKEKGMEFLQKAVDAGLPSAQTLMYNLLSSEKEQSDEAKQKNLSLITQAAEKDDTEAQLLLGSIYCTPNSRTEECEKKGIPWIEKAAASGSVFGLRSLGVVYYARNEFEKSIEPLKKAALQGDGESEFLLGRIYLAGGGYADGYKWVKLAVENGYKQGEAQLKAITDSASPELIADGEDRYIQTKKIIAHNAMINNRRATIRDIRKSFLDRI